MNKRKLASIQKVEAKDEWISLAKRIENADYFVYAENATIEEEKILLLYFYPQGGLREEKKRADFRTFLYKDDYITQDLKVAKVKWLTSSVGRLLERWNWEKWLVCVDDKSEKNIREFINAEDTTFEGLRDFQQQIMADRLDKKHKALKDEIDKRMNTVPELPEDFDKWINEIALYKSRYIFYRYKNGRKKMKGFCTYCHTNVEAENPKHNKEGICPHCNSPITFKAMGKSRNVLDKMEAAIFQKVEEGFVVRYFSVYRDYRVNYKSPTTGYSEIIRDFYIDDKIKSYEWGSFKQSNDIRWRESKDEYYMANASLYDSNLDEILKDTPWKYSAIRELAVCKPGMTFDVYKYLKRYLQYPFIEYLVKLKLYNLALEVSGSYGGGAGRIDFEGKNLQEILKINKSSLPLLQKLDATLGELRLVQVMEREELSLSAELIKYIYENLGCATPLLELAKYTTINKALKYIKVQAEEIKKAPKEMCCHHGFYAQPSRKSDMETAYQDWMDYLGFCKELKYDLNNEFVLYPKNLKEAHDREAALVQAKRDKEAAEKIRKQREKIKNMSEDLLKKYGMKYKNFAIVAPKDADDLKKEGNILHHCVGTYIGKIAEGDSIVLFVRKADKQEDPYCTLEIVNGKVYQCRGKFNEDMKDKLKGLLNKFTQTKLMPMMEKEAV